MKCSTSILTQSETFQSWQLGNWPEHSACPSVVCQGDITHSLKTYPKGDQG